MIIGEGSFVALEAFVAGRQPYGDEAQKKNCLVENRTVYPKLLKPGLGVC